MSAPARAAAEAHSSDLLLREDRGGVALLTLNRPETRNSLSEALLQALDEAMEAIAASNDVRAVVLAGSGPHFCAGHDLKELTAHRRDADRGAAHFARVMGACAVLMRKVALSPKPVIAAVNGVATAAGCQLVAACDLAVAAEDARFCTPGVDIGLFCTSPMVPLSRNIGRKRALEMLLLGEMVDARDAESFGLVNRVVVPDKVLEEALRMGRAIAAKPPATVAAGKRAFQRQIEQSLEEAYAEAARSMAVAMAHPEAQEGIDAFLAKRPPRWRAD